MRKKATTKKIVKKSKKELKTTLKTAKKTTPKKKEQKRVKLKEKKTATKKVKAKIKEKPKKVVKKVVAKIEEKPKKVIKKLIAKIEKKPEKVVKKIVATIKKKLKKVAKEVEVKKKELKAKVKLEKKPKKAAKKIVAKIEKKILFKPEKKVEIKKITKKPKKKVEVKKKEVKVKVKAEIKKKVEAKVELKKPVIEEKYPPTPWETLPAEYGEDSIVLMTVDPNKLFTYWEVREDTLAMNEGNLNVRVYDVTGAEFDGTNANSYFDIAVSERIGSRYIDVSPEKEFITDIGIINIEGIFITIARSNKVSTPRITISEEAVLPLKLYDTGFRVGY